MISENIPLQIDVGDFSDEGNKRHRHMEKCAQGG